LHELPAQPSLKACEAPKGGSHVTEFVRHSTLTQWPVWVPNQSEP